jgi:hypothetical protein
MVVSDDAQLRSVATQFLTPNMKPKCTMPYSYQAGAQSFRGGSGAGRAAGALDALLLAMLASICVVRRWHV